MNTRNSGAFIKFPVTTYYRIQVLVLLLFTKAKNKIIF